MDVADAAVPTAEPAEQATSTPSPAPDQATASGPTQATIDAAPSLSLDDVPEEYRSLVQSKLDEAEALRKSFHGDYTRKTQELAEFRAKADITDYILQHPDAAKVLAILEGAPDAPAADPAALLQTDPAAAIKAIKDEVRREMAEEIAPVKQRFEAQAQAEAAERAEATYKELLTKYPDLPEYEAEVADRVAKGYDVEDAVKSARYDRAYQKGIDEGANAAAKRDAAAQPGTRPSAPVGSPRPRNIREAWDQAKRESGWAG